MSAIESCTLHKDFAQIGILLQIPAPTCIETTQPYRSIGLPLLELVKSMNQRQSVVATPYI